MCVVLPTGVLLFLRKGGGGPRGENRKFPTFGQFGKKNFNLATFVESGNFAHHLPLFIVWSPFGGVTSLKAIVRSKCQRRTNQHWFPSKPGTPNSPAGCETEGIKAWMRSDKLAPLPPWAKWKSCFKNETLPDAPHVLHIMLQNGGGIHILKAKTSHAVPVTLYLLYVGIVVRNCHKCYGSQLKGLY